MFSAVQDEKLFCFVFLLISALKHSLCVLVGTTRTTYNLSVRAKNKKNKTINSPVNPSFILHLYIKVGLN